MFSITVRRASALVSWNVRTMPSRATLYGRDARRSSCRRTSSGPWSGLSKPVSRLKNVVLPAPLGPISAVIAPRWTSTWSTSTATRPPKCAADAVGDEDRVGLGHARARSAHAGAGVDGRGSGQRTSKACSRLSPKMPCGRKTTSSASATPATMYFTWPKLLRVDEPVGQRVVARSPRRGCCRRT